MDRWKAGVLGAAVIVTAAGAVLSFTKDGGISAGQTAEEAAVVTEVSADGQEEQKNPLEKDKYPQIDRLVRSYYEMAAAGDLEGLEEITGNTQETFAQEIEENRKFVEGYQNVEVYTKKAEEEGAFIVFAYYEMKIRDIDTPVPGLGNLYVREDPEGNLIVANGMYDSKVQEYVGQVASDEDVQALVRDVQQKYRRARESDETLRLALDDLQSAYSE